MKMSLKIDTKVLEQKFGKLAARAGDLRPVLETIGREIVSITQRRIDRRIPPPNAPLTIKLKGGNHPLKDLGKLYSSITPRVEGNNTVVVGTNVKYAAIQQFGGTITPKRAKKLAIPVSRKIMRRYGASPRACIEGLKKAGWRVWTSRSGKAILGQKGSRGKPQVLFILKDSVSIPARPFLLISEEEERAVYQILEYFLREEF